jgi:hypothetical protein
MGRFRQKYSIRLKPGTKPVHAAMRRYPAAIRPELKEEITRLLEMGMIAPVPPDEVIDWCHPLVVARKPNGKLRVCLDPSTINRNLIRKKFPLPTIDDIATRVAGAKFFTVLDVNNGYWHLQLDEVSSKICSFALDEGRFRWLVAPFGLGDVGDVFRECLAQPLYGIPGCIAYQDDIMIFGATQAEHDQRLRLALQRMDRAGVRLNPKKAQIRQRRVQFIGYIFENDTIKMDPARVNAIEAFKEPSTRKELQSFIGAISYLHRFATSFTADLKILRELTSESVTFSWQHRHQEAFKRLKANTRLLPTLYAFDIRKSTVLAVDACDLGLGAVLLQEGRPIAYASRTCTKSEQNYPPIEKEMLAVQYGCERFYTYLMGLRFEIQTDHRPLEAIWRKPLSEAPPRLQRLP